MGTFLFRWPHPANDVHVTGTFDDWGKSEQLVKVGDVWEKEVHLRSADEKILYKFVVDDKWITDHEAPKEDDGHFNVNNVLYPHEIKRDPAPTTEEPKTEGTGAALLSSAAPASSTAALAGEQPLEKKPVEEKPEEEQPQLERKLSPPGAFPETPADEPESFNVAPIPATDSIGNPVDLPAGEKVPEPSSITSNTVDSTATTSKEGYEKDASAPYPPTTSDEPADYSVKPIPATSGIGNPINLPAGEKVPDSSNFTSNTVDSTATTSKEGYEHAGEAAAGLLGGTAIGAAAYSAFSKPDEEKKNIIPESSLPLNPKETDTLDAGPTLSSAAPASTASVLAGAVPLEKKRQGMVIDPADAPSAEEAHTAPSVPQMVQESLREAHQDPEAAASPEVVEEKSAVESELLKKTTSSDAVGEPASAAKTQTSYYGLATAVPATVEKSMAEAHASPEAAAETSAVAEKSAVEQELLRKIPTSDGAGEPAPTISAATSPVAPAATEESSSTVKVPGASTVAAAAVADGTERSATPAVTDTAKEVPAEKTEGDATEYAPVSQGATAPGVAPAAAAALSDGTEDPTLADEPAVQLMQQHDAQATEAAPVTATEDATTTETPAAGIDSAAKTETPATTSDKVTDTEAPAAAEKKDLAPVPETRKKSEIRDVSPGTADPKSKVLGPSAAGTTSATSTPTKPIPSGTSSPATSSNTKEKKKKHRISGFFKKIFD